MSSLKLTIRCAHQTNVDLKIDDARSDWTVRQLKIYLSDAHPSKPVPERQRIVFAGQLLRDDARLSEYFQRYDSAGSGATNSEPYVLHLVYTISAESNVAAAENRAKKESELRQRKIISPANPTGPQPQPSPAQTSTVPNAFPAYYWPWQGQQTAPATVPDDWIRQQQQLYTAMSQWYGQYMQAAYGGAMGFYPASPSQQPTVNLVNVTQQQQQEPIAQQPEVPAVQVPPPQQVLNAQGGVVQADDDDPRNRDWLDYVYMACRASLLLMILYFYSSLERFVFVLLCCTLMYGLQAGWFGRRGQQQNDQEARRAAQNAAQGPQQQNVVPNRPEQVVEANGRPEGEPPILQDQPDRGQVNFISRQNAQLDIPITAWNVFWTTCWTFISSFFASLVPERPPPLNL